MIAPRRVWGEALAVLDRTRRLNLMDFVVLVGLAGMLFGVTRIAREWTGPLRPEVAIDLSPRALPRYTFFSLSRGLLAYLLSLGFTLGYGYWAAKDRIAQRVLLPLLDVLQSIPILGFMPGLVLALVAFFPRSNVGLELAAVLMMFTGQVWNMTFSFYHSLITVPGDLLEAATVYRFGPWERFRRVELPFSTLGLVWNSMMSMAGGWFFLMINEAFVLGKRDFRLPGLGSYMSVAVARGDGRAMFFAVIAMLLMILALDQLLWRPVVAWAQKFRVEESGASDEASSWLLTWLRRSRVAAAIRGARLPFRRRARPAAPVAEQPPAPPAPGGVSGIVARLPFVLLVLLILAGALRLYEILAHVSVTRWLALIGSAAWTLGRVLAATAVGTLWTVPVGLAIGLSPRLSRILQPVAQVAASFPAPMLYPAVIALLHAGGVPLGWGSIVLLLLGTQWYILFNVIAGAMAVPADLREAARSFRMGMLARLKRLYLPAVFPFLVTGWVTAAGGAWNASIVSEYVSFHGHTLSTRGVGSAISLAAEHGELNTLAAGVLVLSTVVVLFNRMVWRRCYRLAEDRFSLNR
jgi:NitT/TauT family transport system permease protein